MCEVEKREANTGVNCEVFGSEQSWAIRTPACLRGVYSEKERAHCPHDGHLLAPSLKLTLDPFQHYYATSVSSSRCPKAFVLSGVSTRPLLYAQTNQLNFCYSKKKKSNNLQEMVSVLHHSFICHQQAVDAHLQ